MMKRNLTRKSRFCFTLVSPAINQSLVVATQPNLGQALPMLPLESHTKSAELMIRSQETNVES